MNAQTEFTRITINPAVLNGQPIIRGTRISVRCVVEAVAMMKSQAAAISQPEPTAGASTTAMHGIGSASIAA